MIRVKEVSKNFYTLPVLNKVSLEVEKSKCHVILGQSGVGKSVFLKILAGLIQPDEGDVFLESRNIGMLFQKNALFDSFTVEENLNFTLKERLRLNKAERKKKTAQYLEWVGLEKAGSLYPDELSGGMQKRLGIARALIVQPDILFYDEPTAGLDPITSRTISDLILRLKAELKTTIVVITSDVLRAYQMADYLSLFEKTPQGAILKHAGTPHQAKASSDEAIQQFLQGKTIGPLTSATALDLEMQIANQRLHLKSFGAQLTEHFDVDLF